MKKLLISAVAASVLLTGLADASDEKFRRLDEILAEETSLATAQTMLVRCLALHTIMKNWMARQNSANNQEIAKKFDTSSLKIYKLWVDLNSITTNNTKDDRQEILSSHLNIVSEFYVDKMLKSKTLNGNVFDDEDVASDFMICKNYNNIVSDALEKATAKLKN